MPPTGWGVRITVKFDHLGPGCPIPALRTVHDVCVPGVPVGVSRIGQLISVPRRSGDDPSLRVTSISGVVVPDAIAECELHGQPGEPRLPELARLAARVCDVPLAADLS